MAYFAYADIVKDYTELPAGDTALIDYLILDVQAHVERLTQRVWKKPSEVTKYFSPLNDLSEDENGDEFLLLPDWLGEITTVTNGDAVVVGPTEFVLLPKVLPHYGIQILDSSNKFWTYTGDHQESIEIKGYWYFTLAPPEDLLMAMYRHVVHLYRKLGKGQTDSFPRWVDKKYEELRELGAFA